jgi:hypothetical protein
MEKHIDTAQVVCSNIDFLTIEAVPNGILPKHLSAFNSSEPEPQAGGLLPCLI